MKNTIELKPDQQNELYFNVAIDGTSVPNSVAIRMVCEGEHFDYLFRGTPVGGSEVKVIIPAIPRGNLLEGKDYNASLEVYIDNKKFVPIELNLRLPKTAKVTAEVMSKSSTNILFENENNQQGVTASLKSDTTSKQNKKETVESLKRDIFRDIIKIRK